MVPPFAEFRSLWVVDSEYATDSNGLPIVRCLAGVELRTGRKIALWADAAGRIGHNPFLLPRPALVLCWEVGAEVQSFLRMGWREPVHMYDLMLAFRMLINGRKLPRSIFPLKKTVQKDGREKWTREGVMFPKLLNALRYFHLPVMGEDAKERNRQLAMREGGYSADERQALLRYCFEDVYSTARLVPHLIHHVPFRSVMLRSYCKAVLERAKEVGLPIDTYAWQLFRRHGAAVYRQLAIDSPAREVLTDGGNISPKKFAVKLEQLGVEWRTTSTGRPDSSAAYLASRRNDHPLFQALWAMRTVAQDVHPDRFKKIAVHPDARHRFWAGACGTKSGRNASSGCIFSKPAWARGFLQTPGGYVVAECDFRAEEILIAGALSKDQHVVADYLGGDFYLNLGKRIGYLPAEATKTTHGKERSVMKTVALAINYGSGATAIAGKLKKPLSFASKLLDSVSQHYSRLRKYPRENYLRSLERGYYTTRLGWLVHFSDPLLINGHVMKNLPIQATGSDILHLTTVLIADAGIQILCTIHDSILVSMPERDYLQQLQTVQQCMRTASRTVIGHEIDVETTLYPAGERWLKEKTDKERFDLIMSMLNEHEGAGRTRAD